MNNQRQSNIELARIFAMLFIIWYHLLIYVSSITSSNFISAPIINKLFASFMYNGGGIGVGLFFVITGYFMTYNNRVKSLLKIIFAVYFYALLGCLCFILKYFCSYGFDKLSFIKYLFIPVSSGIWWFPTAYILIMIASPYINESISRFSKKGFILILIFVNFFWFFLNNFYDTPYHRLGQSLFWYLMGSFYRRFLDNKKHNFFLMLSLLILSFICITLLKYYYLYFNSINGNWKILTIIDFFRGHIVLPVVVFFLYYLFININIQSRLINSISETTFGIYLGHGNFYMGYLLKSSFLNLDAKFSQNYFITVIIVVGVFLFITLSFVELFRLRIIDVFLFKILDFIKNTRIFQNNFNINITDLRKEE